MGQVLDKPVENIARHPLARIARGDHGHERQSLPVVDAMKCQRLIDLLAPAEVVDHVTVGLPARWCGRGQRQSRPWIVTDELWSLSEPSLPEPGPNLVAGRQRVPDRQALCGQWEYLPPELGFGSGMTCWRHLAASGGLQRAGVWDQLHLCC
ncbi:transposase [Streptomyces sp. NPDC085932]|uniref:transposase n=1 Tax=Streptomyces sp. NPDC085932 TaxID=3365741 RepID=UPI0037D1E574